MHKLKVTPKNIFVSLLFAVLLFPHLCYFFYDLHMYVYGPDYIQHLKKRQYKPGLWTSTVDWTVGWTQ